MFHTFQNEVEFETELESLKVFSKAVIGLCLGRAQIYLHPAVENEESSPRSWTTLAFSANIRANRRRATLSSLSAYFDHPVGPKSVLYVS
jgi:hypothetical protein